MTLAELLTQMGIPVESVTRMRLGRGVVGKATWVVIVALAVLGLVAARTNDVHLLWGVVGLSGLLVVLYIFKVFSFAKSPSVDT